MTAQIQPGSFPTKPPPDFFAPTAVRFGRGRQKFPRAKFDFFFRAEGVRFELTVPFGTTVFKTVALNHSATLPKNKPQRAVVAVVSG